jgi:hypothetical protein
VTNLYTSGQESIGLEMPQVMLAVQIKNHIEEALEIQAKFWDPVDIDVSRSLGQVNRVCVLQPPPKGSIYSGSRLGVLGMPWDTFPAIATMVDKATPAAEGSRFDQSTDVYVPQLYVDAVVCSDDFEADDKQEQIIQEGVLDRRAKRMLEALRHCVSVDPSLGATVLPLTAPQVAMTDPFVVSGTDPDNRPLKRVFSVSRSQYSLTSYATRLDASQPAPSALMAFGLGG